MSKETISIVIPVYNTAEYLDTFFLKLNRQTYQNFKAYIVYDESTDNSLSILKKYVNQRPDQYEILYSLKKDGLGAARDFALNSGKVVGEYILFLDPDDYPELNFLEKMISKAQETNADVTVCGFERFEDGTNKVLCTEMVNNPNETITNISKFDLLAYMNPVVWDKLYKKSCIEGLRFTNIKRTEDVFWLMRMIPRIKSMAFINEVLYHYRVRDNSLLNTISEKTYSEVINSFISVSKELELYYGMENQYKEIINLIAFFRCGIGITYRAAVNDSKNTVEYCKKSREILDRYYNGWRLNSYLKFKVCAKKGIKGLAIWSCSILYKVGAFPLYVYTYTFFQKIIKKEIKW